MATLNVPSDYATITAAMAAARPGDTIKVASGYRGRGTASLTDDDLTIDAPSDATGLHIVKPLSAKVSTVTVTGGASVKIKAYNASIKTGAGNDVIDCAPSSDTINSGAGDDLIYVHSRILSKISAGSGDDVVVLRYNPFAGFDELSTHYDGGAGIDTVRANDLTSATYTNFEILDTTKVVASVSQLNAFQSVIDSRHDHTQISFTLRRAGGTIDFSKLVGPSDSVSVDGSNAWSGLVVTGTAKADRILGTSHNDVINGAGGDDVIQLAYSWTARGSIDGGSGYDTLRAYDLQRYTVSNVEELQIIHRSGRYDRVNTTVDQIDAFQKITSSSPRDSQIQFVLSGNGGSLNFANKLEAGDTIDVDAGKLKSGLYLKASAGDDVIRTTRFDDVIDGGAGDDHIATYTRYDAFDRPIDTPTGTDMIRAGAGDDVIELYGQGRGVVEGGSGHDTVRAGDLTGYTLRSVEVLDAGIVTARLDQVLSFDTITRSHAIPDNPLLNASANDAVWFKLVGVGGTLDLSHRIEKGRGALVNGDKLTSALDVTGTDRNDSIGGTAYDDHLRGGLGNDILYCHTLGSDIAEGGGGTDAFAFHGDYQPGRFSHIVDFATSDTASRDFLVVKGGVFAGLPRGPLAAVAPNIFKDLGMPGAAVDADDRILYNHNTGVLAFDPDGWGAQAAFTVAVLDNHALLTANDFMIVV